MILNLQKKSERFTHLNLNIYLKATAIKTVGYWLKRQIYNLMEQNKYTGLPKFS